MKRVLNFLYCFYHECDEIVDGYPVIRDSKNPAFCWVTNPRAGKWGFWDRNHPNYKIRVKNILNKFKDTID